MSDLFISHAEEDAELALSIAVKVEASGFSTWYYERDAVPGVSYLLQVTEEIDRARAVVLLISTASLAAHQVTTEIVRAHEAAKPILPLLVDVTHGEFQIRQPEWRAAVGAATSISLAARSLDSVVQAIIAGLAHLNIQPAGPTQPAIALPGTDPGLRQPIDAEPYDGFDHSFRELVAPQRIVETGAMLHVVFGNIADIRQIPVVIPVGQAFDFNQRGPRSVLASFDRIRVEGRPFYDDVDDRWPRKERPKSAGLGHCKYLPLAPNTLDLPGVIFVVTTRDLSIARDHYGHYTNTPVEGIDIIMDKVIEVANSHKLSSLAVPLLGSGYANIRRTKDDAMLAFLLRQAVTLIAVEKLQENLRLRSSTLRRGIVVIYSQNPQSEDEHALWESVARFLGSRSGSSTQIDELLKAINALCI